MGTKRSTDENVRLSQKMMAQLFEDNEPEEDAVTRNFLIAAAADLSPAGEIVALKSSPISDGAIDTVGSARHRTASRFRAHELTATPLPRGA